MEGENNICSGGGRPREGGASGKVHYRHNRRKRHRKHHCIHHIIIIIGILRLCISIIEREKKETFLESLLNTCQEWWVFIFLCSCFVFFCICILLFFFILSSNIQRYHERGELLRSSTSPPGRWPAFMAFLNEMYGLVSSTMVHLAKKGNVSQCWDQDQVTFENCEDSSFPFLVFYSNLSFQLKRRQLQLLTKYEGVPPKLVLLRCLFLFNQQNMNIPQY